MKTDVKDGPPLRPSLPAPRWRSRHSRPARRLASSVLTEGCRQQLGPPPPSLPSPEKPGPPLPPLSLLGPLRGPGARGLGGGSESAARRPRPSGRSRLGSRLCGPPRGSEWGRAGAADPRAAASLRVRGGDAGSGGEEAAWAASSWFGHEGERGQARRLPGRDGKRERESRKEGRRKGLEERPSPPPRPAALRALRGPGPGRPRPAELPLPAAASDALQTSKRRARPRVWGLGRGGGCLPGRRT